MSATRSLNLQPIYVCPILRELPVERLEESFNFMTILKGLKASLRSHVSADISRFGYHRTTHT